MNGIRNIASINELGESNIIRHSNRDMEEHVDSFANISCNHTNHNAFLLWNRICGQKKEQELLDSVCNHDCIANCIIFRIPSNCNVCSLNHIS